MKSDLVVDVVGETCPVPLIETRKAIKKATDGQIVEIHGNHPASKKEIPMAMENLKQRVLEIKEDDDGIWQIIIKKSGD